MPPLTLPSHLSYKAALILLPPTKLTEPIQKVREIHDRGFNRWPPHINLIYPFLAAPSSSLDLILPRIRSSLTNFEIFNININRSAHFQHSKGSATVYLTSSGDDPTANSMNLVTKLQEALQIEFSECDAEDRPFIPHLSVGQAKRAKGVASLQGKIDEVMKDFSGSEANWTLDWLVDRVVVIEREGHTDPFKIVGEVMLPDIQSGQ